MTREQIIKKLKAEPFWAIDPMTAKPLLACSELERLIDEDIVKKIVSEEHGTAYFLTKKGRKV